MNNKHKKNIVMIIVFVLLILIMAYVVYGVTKNTYNKVLTNEVFQSLENNDVYFFADNKFYTSLKNRLKEKDYNLTSDISLSTTMKDNIFSSLDLSKFNFSYNIEKDNTNDLSYHKMSTKYGGNHLLIVEAINDKKIFAIKSDEIVNRYVGLKKDNLESISSKLLEKDVDLSKEKVLKNFLLDREDINMEKLVDNSTVKPYIDIVKEKVSGKNITKKENVIVTLENDQVSTTEYTISFSSEQLNYILRNFSRQLELDDELISQLTIGNVTKVDTKNTTQNTIFLTKGEENNYNATINIWGENEPIEEQQPIDRQNTVSQENTISTNVDNQNIISQEQNTVINQIDSSEITNSVQIDNATSNQESVNTETSPQTTQENPTEQQQEIQPEEADNFQQLEQQPAQETIDETEEDENTIPEEDNFRTQGFISINEDTRYYGDDDFIIGENYGETFKNIEKLADDLNWISYIITGAKANCNESEMLEYIQNNLNDRIKNANTLNVKLYVAENKAVKINLEFPETHETFDIEIVSKGDKEKYLNLKFLTGEENDITGYSVSLYKKVSDNLNKLKYNINKINKNKINKKIIINIETKGNSNSQKYTNDLDFSISDIDGEFKVNTSNIIDFGAETNIEELNDENCLFIDEISDEELLQTSDAIKDKLLLVLREKNQNLNIIDTANSNTVILSNEDNNNE